MSYIMLADILCVILIVFLFFVCLFAHLNSNGRGGLAVVDN